MELSHFYDALLRNFTPLIPHARECGIVVERLDQSGARARLPYRPEWLGDSERNRIHTGIVTTFVDTIAGLAAVAAIGRFETVATLDLRMDFLRPARAGCALYTHASCYRLTRSIAFVRAHAWQDDEAEAVAVAQATFMRAGSRP